MKTRVTIGFCAVLGWALAGCGGGGGSIQTSTSFFTPTPASSQHIYLWAGPNPGWIYVYRLPLTTAGTPVTNIGDGGTLNTMAFDPGHRLFVTQGQQVQVFTQPITERPCCTWFDLATTEGSPQDIKFDSIGDAFVSGTRPVSANYSLLSHRTQGVDLGCRPPYCKPPPNNNVAVIDVFRAPVTSSSAVNFTIGVGSEVGGQTRPVGIAVDGSGNLWAATNSTMFEYTPPFGSTSVPSLQFPIDSNPSDLAFDSAGNMYAASLGGVAAYSPPFTASSTSAFTIGMAGSAHYLGFDAAGNLYVTNTTAGVAYLLMYSPPFSGASRPVVTLALAGAYDVEGVAIGP